MHIEHAYFYLYKFAKENKVKIDASVLPMLLELKSQFKLYQDAYFNKNTENIHKIFRQKNKFQFGECLELIESSKGKNPVIVSYIREIFRLQQVGCSPILSMNLAY